MKIGIDAHVIGKKKAGAETYSKNLIYELSCLDSENQYQIFLSEKGTGFEKNYKNLSNFKFEIIPTENLLLERFISLPLRSFKKRLDLLHTHRIIPFFCHSKTIVTIYDIAHEKHPELFSKIDSIAMKTLIPISARNADRIITISETSKKDLVDYYNVAEEKISVIPLAVDLNKYKKIEPEIVSQSIKKYQINSKFILYLGAIEPRKNLINLVKAFGELKKHNKIDHKLVIAGGRRKESKSDYFENLLKNIKELGLTSNVVFLGYIEDNDIPFLYNAADIFIFPSLFEGFGLPPLEAMACGTPVIVSNIPSLMEIVSDGALVIDPADPDDIAQAIFQILSDVNLSKSLSEKGIKQAAKFSWRNTAQKTLEVYQDLFKINDSLTS
ncbi:MAG: glycosyltransferase family 4 protein [Actinobacteria bacterium]|nr:glycosyltransferase family 4 protein [Actinomycetota bacterium]